VKILEIQEDSNGVVLTPLHAFHEDAENAAEEPLMQPAPAQATAPVSLNQLPPAVWALIFTYLYNMTYRHGFAKTTMFFLGTLSREFDQLIPKIPMGSFGEYPRGFTIFILYNLKSISLSTARGLLKHSVEDLNEDIWRHEPSYTSRQLLAYRSRYEAGARFCPAENDIIFKIAEIQALLLPLFSHSKRKQEKIRYLESRMVAMMLVITLVLWGFWIHYARLTGETHCNQGARPEDQECKDTLARKHHYDDLSTIYLRAVFISFSLCALPMLGATYAKKWESIKLFNTCSTSLEGFTRIFGDAPLSDYGWFFSLYQIKILHPFLTEEEQAANSEILDHLRMKLKSQLDVESGQPAREMLRM
jgi:hypothetical protein